MNTKIDSKKVMQTATLGVSAGVGALVSKGAMSIAPASFRKPLVRGVLAAAALVAASTISGNDTTNTAIKGALLGVGIQQTAEAVIGFVKPSVAVEPATTAQKFIAGAVQGIGMGNPEFVLPAIERRASQTASIGGGFAPA